MRARRAGPRFSRAVVAAAADGTAGHAMMRARCRAKYDETIWDVKKKVEESTGVPVDKQLLFWHFKELTEEYNNKTLLDLNLHTGFSLTGYDLVGLSLHVYSPFPLSIDGVRRVLRWVLALDGWHYNAFSSATDALSPFSLSQRKRPRRPTSGLRSPKLLRA